MSVEDAVALAFDYVEEKLLALVEEGKKSEEEIEIKDFKEIAREYLKEIKETIEYFVVRDWLNDPSNDEEIDDWLFGEGYGYEELACYYAECSEETLKALIKEKGRKKEEIELELKIIKQHLKWRKKEREGI